MLYFRHDKKTTKLIIQRLLFSATNIVIINMGLFSSPSEFFGGVGDGFKSLFGGISDIGREIFDTAKSVVKAPGEILKKVVDRGADVVEKVTGDVKETVVGASKEIGGAVTNLGQSFAWPIAIVAGGLGAVYLLKNK